MPQHVAVNREIEAGAFTDALDEPIDGIRREWAAPFRRENVVGVRELRP
jgi:hypothetical protein